MKKRTMIMAMIMLIVINIRGVAYAFDDLDEQMSITKNSPGQIWQLLGLVGTIIGIALALFLIHRWKEYRNARDPHYWIGSYDVLPVDFREDGKISDLKAGRCGGGRSAMPKKRDFHQTAAAFMPPVKGEKTSPGFWKIY